jgi:hypothetical protein
MTRIASPIAGFLVLHIHVATSLSQIHLPEPAANKMTMGRSKFQTALIIGSSVDRYALSSNYPHQAFTFKIDPHQHSVVYDKGRNVGMAILQHAGVGLHGDLNCPCWNPGLAHATAQTREDHKDERPVGTAMENPSEAHWRFFPTWNVINHAPDFSKMALGSSTPDLVVVETSLWDLAGWWQNSGHRATPERLEQWCDKDLPYLLKNVSAVFPQSRILFRTAPKVALSSTQKWTQENFEAMHDCVLRRSAGTGQVYERVGVIDYYDIMEKLITSSAKSHLEDLWRPDGYHPAQMPGRLYLNEIFKLLGVQPLEAPDESRRLLGEGEDIFVEDEDYL